MKYEAQLQVTVTRTYLIVLQADAEYPVEAEGIMRHRAMGMTQAQIEEHIRLMRDGSNLYEGAAIGAELVGNVEEVEPDEEELIVERENQAEAAEADFAEWAAADPEAAERVATELALDPRDE